MISTSIAWKNNTRRHASRSSRFEECLGLLQVSGVKALGEPVVDLPQQLSGFLAFALALPQQQQAAVAGLVAGALGGG
jgi:hypothetical protein